MENLELRRRRIFSIADSYLTQLGPWTICSNNDATSYSCAVRELRNHSSPIFREGYICEQFAILLHCC